DPSFDVASIGPRFDNCAFRHQGSGPTLVYVTTIDNGCLSASGPVPVPTLPNQVTSAGLAPDQHLLVMSFDPKLVAAELRLLSSGGATIADHPEAAALAGALEADDTADLLFGTGVCEEISNGAVKNPTPENLQQLQQARVEFGGHPYVAL